MNKDSLRFERRQAFIKKRKEAYKKVMENHPGGITRDNLDQVKKEIKKEEEGDG